MKCVFIPKDWGECVGYFEPSSLFMFKLPNCNPKSSPERCPRGPVGLLITLLTGLPLDGPKSPNHGLRPICETPARFERLDSVVGGE